MLNKRIKSLLVAGLVIVGMTGAAFAEGTEAGGGTDGCRVPGLRGHDHSGNSHHVTNITEASWNTFVSDFNKANEGKFKIEESGGKFKVINLANNKQVEIIHVTFNKELTDEQIDAKSGNPTVPNLPNEEPPTGDASIMPIVATAVMSAAGLYVVCKKDDEE